MNAAMSPDTAATIAFGGMLAYVAAVSVIAVVVNRWRHRGGDRND